jgi:glycine/D-amino acid oxidase-like deaminating enzyme
VDEHANHPELERFVLREREREREREIDLARLVLCTGTWTSNVLLSASLTLGFYTIYKYILISEEFCMEKCFFLSPDLVLLVQ